MPTLCVFTAYLYNVHIVQMCHVGLNKCSDKKRFSKLSVFEKRILDEIFNIYWDIKIKYSTTFTIFVFVFEK